MTEHLPHHPACTNAMPGTSSRCSWLPKFPTEVRALRIKLAQVEWSMPSPTKISGKH